ncbi:MAG: hypothetical protein U1C19_03555 [Methanobacteriaceae archaeon]|nr:hypothetical protein [Methanobacteriaceae archaeon]
MDNKGVFSTDLIISTLMVIIITTGIMHMASERMDIAHNFDKLTKTRQLSEKIASTINKVDASPGQGIYIKMPDTLANSSNYMVSVNSSGVFIMIDGLKGKSAIYPIIISNGVNEGPVLMYPGKTYLIQNNPGKTKIIFINEIKS